MIFQSCCCQQQSPHEMAIGAGAISTDEARMMPGGDPSGAEVLVNQQRLIGIQAQSPAERPESARSFTPEQKEAEKQRLQALVSTFARKAVKGRPCTYIADSGRLASGIYFVSKNLQHLTITTAHSSSTEISCAIASIQDIFSMSEDGSECFPGEVYKAVARERPDDIELLLMVIFQGPDGVLGKFCMLESSAQSRSDFLECMRVLCIYAQSPATGKAIDAHAP